MATTIDPCAVQLHKAFKIVTRFTSVSGASILLMVSMWPILAHAEFAGKVVGVIDGDSIRVMHEGQAEQVRLTGIDCPERKQVFGTKGEKSYFSVSIGEE